MIVEPFKKSSNTAGNSAERLAPGPAKRPYRAPLNPDDVRRCAAKGLSVTEIAKALHCDHSTVSSHAKRHGITIHPSIVIPGRDPSPFWQQHDGTLRAMREAGASFSAIAAALGINKGAAIGRANRLGLIGRDRPARARKNLVPAPEPGGCRWLHGHPGHAGAHWCKAPAKPGSSYCEAHHRRVYRPAASSDPLRLAGEAHVPAALSLGGR